jgi:5-(carboxyamino)imidazole ribonucleotide mutase
MRHVDRDGKRPLVAIVMGSDADLGVMGAAAQTLTRFGVPHEVRVVSAHRTPGDTLEFAKTAASHGLRVIIAGAAGSGQLAGMMAAVTTLPVIGVPISQPELNGLDSLLSTAQMPPGVPVATVSVGGAKNAALLAVRILSIGDPSLRRKLARYAAALRDETYLKDASVREQFP